jgi:hypothetical protein
MMLQFSRKSKASRLPEKVRSEIISEFQMNGPQVDQLRCVGKKGVYAGRPVKYMRVFDPTRVPEMGKGSPKYDDVKTSWEASLFEVRLEQNGSIYLTDMRPGKLNSPVSPSSGGR